MIPRECKRLVAVDFAELHLVRCARYEAHRFAVADHRLRGEPCADERGGRPTLNRSGANA